MNPSGFLKGYLSKKPLKGLGAPKETAPITPLKVDKVVDTYLNSGSNTPEHSQAEARLNSLSDKGQRVAEHLEQTTKSR